MGRASSARSTLCARRERDDFAGSHRRTPVRRFELQTIDAEPKKPVPERELHERPTELFSIPQHREHVIEPRDARAVAQVDRKLNDRRHVCRGWRRDPATDANVCIEARDRMRLERLCRYTGRPAVATERLTELPDRRLLYRFETPMARRNQCTPN
ncbi:transposase [Edaphobacter aggregans]|uniref:transposase n=1 Tax=Edaphobacter aggregans TaxID=570835 RepID=UPI00147073F8